MGIYGRESKKQGQACQIKEGFLHTFFSFTFGLDRERHSQVQTSHKNDLIARILFLLYDCLTIIIGCLLFITIAPVNKRYSLSEGTFKEAVSKAEEL
jgi:hypothetical protein